MAIYSFALHDAMPEACRGGVLSIGNFDGVHLGHQALLTEAVRQARLLAVPSVAVTFDPHPSQLLRPQLVQPLLTSIDDRIALLQQCGIDHVLMLKTSAELLQLSARAFFEQILLKQLKARALVEGYNFGFGRGREGTTEVLQQLCAEIPLPLTLLPPQQVMGLPVSSSRVRAEILAGAVEVVAQLLGRPYRIKGRVVTGQRRGATLGFPTANLDHVANLVPGNGVYAVHALRQDKSWPAAAHVGPNPTFGERPHKIEVHLLGFGGDLYGQSLAVDFIARIRATRSFSGIPELVSQIQTDLADIRKILKILS